VNPVGMGFTLSIERAPARAVSHTLRARYRADQAGQADYTLTAGRAVEE
jgi:hypothetical protein